jgi:hypothetical protein
LLERREVGSGGYALCDAQPFIDLDGLAEIFEA